MAAEGERKDPYLNNRFRVALEIDGVVEAGFSECAGLVVETEVEERREGGLNQYAHRLPKGSKVANLVLKRGLTDSERLWKWHQDLVSGKVKAVNLSVILLDSAGAERWRWNVKDAYPAKWMGPELKADASAVAIETLELVHHGITKG
jgi:phage tail-like protein